MSSWYCHPGNLNSHLTNTINTAIHYQHLPFGVPSLNPKGWCIDTLQDSFGFLWKVQVQVLFVFVKPWKNAGFAPPPNYSPNNEGCGFLWVYVFIHDSIIIYIIHHLASNPNMHTKRFLTQTSTKRLLDFFLKSQVDPVLDLTICKCLTYGHLVQDLENLISIKGGEGSVPHCGGVVSSGEHLIRCDTWKWGFFCLAPERRFCWVVMEQMVGFSVSGGCFDGIDGRCRVCIYVFIRFTTITGWWQLNFFLIFTPKIGEDDPFWREYISNGLVQPPTR